MDLGEEEGLAENIAWGKRLNETAVDMAGGLWIAHVGVMPEDAGSAKWARFRDSLAEIAAPSSICARWRRCRRHDCARRRLAKR